MKPIHELYREFIEKLRMLIDSQVNMSQVRFDTDTRYLRVIFLKAGANDPYSGVYRVEYGHHDTGRKVRFHFVHIKDLHDFIKMAVWKNPRYATLRKEFKEKDYFVWATKKMARQMKEMHQKPKVPPELKHLGVDHGGYQFITEH